MRPTAVLGSVGQLSSVYNVFVFTCSLITFVVYLTVFAAIKRVSATFQAQIAHSLSL